MIAALVHLDRALGFPCGMPSRNEVSALRATRRYRHLVDHLVQEGPS